MRRCRSAAHAVDLTFTTPPYNHNAIEPHAAIAVWTGDDRVTVYDTSQFTAGGASSLAHVFGLKSENVTLLAPFVGGGFGGKGTLWFYNQLCVMAARMTGRPVRICAHARRRVPPRRRAYAVAAARGDRRRRRRQVHGVHPRGRHGAVQREQLSGAVQLSAPPLVPMESYRIGQKVTNLHRIANTFMRAPGESIGTFAVESAIDALAYELKMDPIELRARNEPDADPVSGHEFSSRHMREAYAIGAERFGWRHRPPEPRAQRDGDWLIGQGVATGTYPVYRMATAARVRINADGTAVVQTSCQEMGMGTATVQTQHAAERLGLPLENVRFEYGDSSLPWAGVAGGSSQTVSVALAVHQAADELVKAFLALAQQHADSPLAKASLKEVHAAKSGIYLRDQPATGETYAAILQRAGQAFIEREVKTRSGMEAMKYSMHSYAAQFCEAAVHEQTGEVRIRRWVGVLRHRPDPQSEDRRLSVPRRHRHGDRHGAHRGDGVRRPHRPHREREPRGISRAGAGRRAVHRRRVHRRARSAYPARRPRHR